MCSRSLQWRAEQSLGQTGCRGRLRRWMSPTFNGGPSNRSAKPAAGFDQCFGDDLPSMEGRAIARPNRLARGRPGSWWAFNGGPSNRSANPWRCSRCRFLIFPFNGGPSNRSAKLTPTGSVHSPHPPSMEGRAIARPNSGGCRRCVLDRLAFNGGPSNRSAKHGWNRAAGG